MNGILIFKHLRKCCHIKTLIGFLFIFQIIFVIVVVVYLSFQNNEKEINSIVDRLLLETSNGITQELNTYTETASLINKSNREIILNSPSLFNDKSFSKDELVNFFYKEIILFPKIHHIYWGSAKGEFYGIKSNAEDERLGNDQMFLVSDRETDNYLKLYRIKSYDNLIRNKIKYSIPLRIPGIVKKKYNPKERFWYLQAAEAKKQIWTTIDLGIDDKRKSITNVYPVYNPKSPQELFGVLGVDLYSNFFSKFIQKIKVYKNSKILIINNKKELVISSEEKENFAYPKASFKLVDNKNIVNKKIGYLLKKEELSNIKKTKRLDFKIKKNKYFLLIEPLKDTSLDWFVLTIISMSDSILPIRNSIYEAVLLSAVLIILGSTIAFLAIESISKPILKISNAAKSLAAGNWNQKIKVDRQDELGQLARSFNTMASHLQKSFTALEETNHTLELKVLDRTKELSQTVERLKATQEKLVFENELLKNDRVEEYQYQIGGTLPIESPTYVVRKADKLLYKALKQGQFCYIFNARQMGKSSLRAKIMHKLSEEGLVCAALDLTEILSDNVTESQFYNSIIFNLAKKLDLLPEFDYRTWKKNLDYLSSLEKLGEFIEEIVLKRIHREIVIFIDEIDTVLDLTFSVDSFFGFWRSLYNKRADNYSYRRLTLVLIGRTAPNYLIQSPESTPFNIGCGIPLEGFKLHEVERSLMNGLKDNCDEPYTTIKEVLEWTAGQPFLTQKICSLISLSNERVERGKEQLFTLKLIREEIIDDWENKDQPEHLKTIRNKLTKNKRNPLQVLQKYREILTYGEIKDEKTWECLELFLSGIVRREGGKLKLYNPIYETVFDRPWVEREMHQLALA